MKKALGWVVSWALYCLGDILSVPMCRYEWARFYRQYNWLMIASSKAQMWGGAGPWLVTHGRLNDKSIETIVVSE